MAPLLAGLGATLPVLAAPMAGGPTTASMVVAAGRAGSLGFLAGAYQTADALAAQVAEVESAGVAFGVNLFAPSPVAVDPTAYRVYAESLRPDAEALGLDWSPGPPREDDDGWASKVDWLVSHPVPLVSFTFGLAPAVAIAALHRAGITLAQTVTTKTEARLALDAGVDLLVVQAAAAGGHSGTFTPERDPEVVPIGQLVAMVRAETTVPIIAAGGVAVSADIPPILAAGADAVAVGTALLRSTESGASEIHKAALVDVARPGTVLTRAFTGRPARAIPVGFIRKHQGAAPVGYPAIHHLTAPIRRAAASAGDIERMHLWAGAGRMSAREGTTADILAGLSANV